MWLIGSEHDLLTIILSCPWSCFSHSDGFPDLTVSLRSCYDSGCVSGPIGLIEGPVVPAN